MSNLGKIIRESVPDGYYVGGVLRDALMRRYSGDIDLAMPREEVKTMCLEISLQIKSYGF